MQKLYCKAEHWRLGKVLQMAKEAQCDVKGARASTKRCSAETS